MAKTEPADTLYADYVCPTHGVIHTIEPLGDDTAAIPVAVACAHDETSGGCPAICAQTAPLVVRSGVARDTEAGDPNPHPTGQAAEATREEA